MFTLPSHHGGSHHPPTVKPSKDDQVVKDRRTGVLFIALLVAILGLILWMASWVQPVQVEPNDFWHLMP